MVSCDLACHVMSFDMADTSFDCPAMGWNVMSLRCHWRSRCVVRSGSVTMVL